MLSSYGSREGYPAKSGLAPDISQPLHYWKEWAATLIAARIQLVKFVLVYVKEWTCMVDYKVFQNFRELQTCTYSVSGHVCWPRYEINNQGRVWAIPTSRESIGMWATKLTVYWSTLQLFCKQHVISGSYINIGTHAYMAWRTEQTDRQTDRQTKFHVDHTSKGLAHAYPNYNIVVKGVFWWYHPHKVRVIDMCILFHGGNWNQQWWCLFNMDCRTTKCSISALIWVGGILLLASNASLFTIILNQVITILIWLIVSSIRGGG